MPNDDSANSEKFKAGGLSTAATIGFNWSMSAKNRVHHIARRLGELDVPGLAAATCAGVPVEFALALFDDLAMSLRQSADLLGLSRTSISRRHQAREPLQLDEAERVVDLARLFALVLSGAPNSPEGREHAAWRLKQWLHAVHPKLNQTAPASVMSWGFGRAHAVLLLQQDLAQGRL